MIANGGQFSQAEPVEDEYKGKILSASHIAIAKGIDIASVVIFILGLIVFGWHPSDLPVKTKYILYIISFLVMGIALFIGNKQSSIMEVWIQKVARRMIKKRFQSLVAPNDKDSIFVAIIQRTEFEHPMIYNATDVGFLRVNFETNCILFEGDNDRYCIPATDIVGYSQEQASHFTSRPFLTGYASRTYSEKRYFFLILKANFSGQTIELPFRILSLWSQDKQGAANLQLISKINRLIKRRGGA